MTEAASDPGQDPRAGKIVEAVGTTVFVLRNSQAAINEGDRYNLCHRTLVKDPKSHETVGTHYLKYGAATVSEVHPAYFIAGFALDKDNDGTPLKEIPAYDDFCLPAIGEAAAPDATRTASTTFLHRVIYHPAPGQGPALRELLLSQHWAGRWSLSTRLWGQGGQFRVNHFAGSLAELEAGGALRPNPAIASPLQTLLATTPRFELEEALTPTPQADFTYVVRFAYEPAQGKVMELRRQVEAYVAERRTAGANLSCGRNVSSGLQAVFVQAFFADLAALQAARARTLADPATQAYGELLAGLLARPADAPEVYQVLARSA